MPLSIIYFKIINSVVLQESNVDITQINTHIATKNPISNREDSLYIESTQPKCCRIMVYDRAIHGQYLSERYKRKREYNHLKGSES